VAQLQPRLEIQVGQHGRRVHQHGVRGRGQ
jgi:hypothetical protein